MRTFLSALTLLLSVSGMSVSAQNATVIELYTSQGCSSCPPADEMLTKLAERDDVIALALHVDYWDYLGWVDDLARPEYTERQRAFARARGSRTVYTPQMVFGGVDHVIGSRPMEVMDLLQAHSRAQNDVDVTLHRDGDLLQIGARAVGAFEGDVIVQIVRYTPNVTRDIRRGENAGATITYSNVVHTWVNAGTWDMQTPLAMRAELSGDDPVAVIIQDGADGAILGAAQLR